MTPEERAKADDIWDKIDRAKTDASKERLWKRFDALVRQAVERRYPPMESI